MKIFIGLIAIQFAIASGCTEASDLSSRKENKVQYQYELNESVAERLIKDAQSLKRGDTIAYAKKILGGSSFEGDRVGKKGEFYFRELRYDIKTVDVGLVNIHDKYVSLHFDSSGQLIDIEMHKD